MLGSNVLQHGLALLQRAAARVEHGRARDGRLTGLGVGAAATLALASCTSSAAWVNPDSAAVRDRERQRGGTGKTTAVTLTAASASLDLAGTTAQTFAYGAVPAPIIRLSAGDTLKATIRNQLPVETSVHWHGLALRNDMDGASPATPNIKPGNDFTYAFVVA